jgi:hypothetical protein
MNEPPRNRDVPTAASPPVLTPEEGAPPAPAPASPPRGRFARVVLTILGVEAAVGYVAVAAIWLPIKDHPDQRAVILMGGGLLAIWVLIGGLVMRLGRDRLAGWLRRVPIGWRTRFVLLCVVLALLEEAVTTGLTNAAPLFGGVSPAARITDSTNYLEVVLLHSVIVFWPAFVGWAAVLSFVRFAPSEVMLLFGLTGWLAELRTYGLQNVGMIGMWVFVYGLMVYLPACTVPPDRRARPARWWHWPLAVVVSVLASVPMVPVSILIRWLALKAGLHG